MWTRLIASMAILVVLVGLASCSAAPTAPSESAASAVEAVPAAEAPAAPEMPVAPVAESATQPAGLAGVAYTEPCTPENASGALARGKLRLVIGTGGAGGVFFPYGSGLADIITEKLENAEASAEVTGGSVDNMKLVQAGDADIGMATMDSAYNAINGADAYAETGPVPACALATLYTSFVHVVAPEESGIETLADMTGKRISVGSVGSSTEGVADRLLEAAGLDPSAGITRSNLSVTESVNALKDEKIDAFFWIGGLPTSAVTDLVNTPGIRVKFLDTSGFVDPLREKYGPVYTAYTLPKAVYGLDADLQGVGIGNTLFVNANMPSELAYKLLTTIFGNLEAVQQVHPEATRLSLAGAVEGSSIPYHPGAIQYYVEQGVWQK